jgi:hypothetical protein
LIESGRKYIVNVRGPKEVASAQAATVQVVPGCYIYDWGDLGLTLHLPFDVCSGTFAELVNFLDTQGHELFDEYRYQGIPCFVISMERDIELAESILYYVLEKVYEYPRETPFICEVYDQGPDSSDEF